MDLKEMWNSNTQKLEKTETFQYFQQVLKEDKWYKTLLDFTEDSSNLNRVYIVTGSAFVFLAILFYQFGIQLICGAVGFLYPAYQTIECIEKLDAQEGKRWLTYWVVFSAFNFLEILLFFLHWIPGYWIVKCVFFMWCYVPAQINGADVVYNFVIRPHFQKNREAIDEAVNTVMKTAQAICSEPNLDAITQATRHHLE